MSIDPYAPPLTEAAPISHSSIRVSDPTWIRILLGMGLPYGAGMALFFSRGNQTWASAAVMGLASGLLFAAWMGWCGRRQSRLFEANPPDSQGEEIVLEGVARHFGSPKTLGGQGGYLVLTRQHLRFRAYRPNHQSYDWSLKLPELARIEIGRNFGLIPSGLRLTLPGGKRKRFVVND